MGGVKVGRDPIAPSAADDETRAAGSMHSSPVPTRLGRYAVGALLGRGGMGEVFAVTDAILGRDVAAKVSRNTSDPSQAERLAREARITGGLEHPGIVPIYELAADPSGVWFFTMKQVQGRDLERVLLDDEPRLHTMLSIFRKACDAMAFAHAKGVVHRDLKPANLMVGRFGEVYVMDFGLARVLAHPSVDGTRSLVLQDDGTEPHVSRRGAIVGTPAYMAPEQARGDDAALDHKADVYALGAVLYRMLAGVAPYVGNTAWDILAQVGQPVVPPSARSPDRRIPRELDAIVARAMEADPARRYANVGELAADIDAFLDDRTVAAARYGLAQRAGKLVRRHRVASAALTGAVLVALVALGARELVARAAAARQRSAARAAVAALEPARRFERAEALLASAPVPDGGASIPAEAREALSRGIPPMRELVLALDEWGAVESGLVEVARARAQGQLLLGRLALAADELALAEHALAQANRLDPEGGAHAVLARLEERRAARTDERQRRAHAVLEAARAGRLTSERGGAYQAALFELARDATPGVVDQLIAVVERDRDRRHACTRAALLAAAQARALEPAIAIEGAIDAWIATLRPSDRGRLATLDIPTYERLARVFDALVLHDASRRSPAEQRHWMDILVDAQRAATGDAHDELRLAAEALGLAAPRGPAALALATWIWSAWSEREAVPVGLALVQASERDERAAPWLVELVNPPVEPGRMKHWATSGVFWQAILAALGQRPGGAGATVAADATSVTRALALLARGEVAGAEAAFGQAIAAGESPVLAHFHRGELRQRRGDLAGARADYDRAIELDPGRASLWTVRGVLRHAQGEVEPALADLSRGIELAPEDSQAWTARADVLRVLSRFDLALADAEKACSLAGEGDAGFAWLARARVRRLRGDSNSAVADASLAVERCANPVDALYERALCYEQLGRYDFVLADTERALRLAPERRDLVVARARAKRQLGRLDEALAEVAAVLAVVPNDVDALEVRAKVRSARGDHDGALADARRIVEQRGESAHSWQVLMYVDSLRGDAAAAIASGERAVALAPTDAALLADLALMYVVGGERARALVATARALELDPRCTAAYTTRARVREEEGDHAAAIADYGEVIRLDSGHVVARINRGDLFRRARKLELALADFEDALALSQVWWQAWYGRALALEGLGRREEAARSVREAMGRAPPANRAELERALSRMEGR